MQKITNEQGKIEINEEVIASICGICAGECYGIVGMASRSVKDGIVRLLLRDNITKGIAVKLNEDHIDVEFHIIVEYGTKISAVTDNLMNTIRYKLKEMLDIKVETITVFVESVRLDS
ncbi:Asp23/Gls24 family envelope stress response protein [Candidatus Epulonipiscium viviparus]|uniref:Asp23/Gls24 family envelope stress response protein n=1 Tax=Candidatus Epulonipiscium viviparus TaxID=420336 RepID=UPI00016BFB24|nr:Asp23/Gls24 family envelope stress response protein [Candidatus Epulopiscium viviparus]